MRLYINEKLFSMHNKYFIKDETGKAILEISSKVISIGDKTYIKDLNGNELAYIEQEVLHLMSKYNITINNHNSFSISKQFNFLENNYILSNHYKVDGNFLNHSFIIYNDQNEQVGEINRKYFTIGDKYELNIYNEKDYMIILTIMVAIINDIDRSQNRRRNS